MRSAVKLPADMKLYPAILKDAGYYCTNNSKTDYNFDQPDTEAGWNESGKKAHWRNRPEADQPFFSIFNFTISHESKIRNKPHTLVHDPAKAKIPVYHPDVPEVRRDWAQYYDRLTEMDAMVGNTLKQLEKDGLADSTIVFYYGDHGSGMPRSKRWPFNSGLQVPFILHVPDAYKDLAPADYLPGGISERLVSFVDMGPTAISLAGAEVPENMQGIPFCGKAEGPAKEYLFGYRGRMDERIDLVRSCTDGRFVYMRHFYPDRPYLKHVGFMFQTPTTQIWKEMYDAGELNDAQAKFWQDKPVEELFDLQNDPDEVNNIATDPKHVAKLDELRAATKQWMIDTHDLGVLTEAGMHERAGGQPPLTMANDESFPIAEIVNAAWRAGDAWAAFDKTTAESMAELTESDEPIFRFWACRGLHLGLQSHVGVVEESTVTLAVDALNSHMKDSNSNVRLAAAEGLLQFGNESQKTNAAKELMRLVNLPERGYFVGIAAMNVVDEHYEKVIELSGMSLDGVTGKHADVPKRGNDYVGRLLETVRGRN